jgi:hypothetical protein
VPFVRERIRVEGEPGSWQVRFVSAAGLDTTAEGIAEELRRDRSLAPVIHGAGEAEKTDHKRRVAETINAGQKH